ncbi:MAG TPA: hypothetical protein VL463_35210 [Kofleriaceae bacterium]|nr:hypothetical protein [Kofleriaceae bacterium]
MPRDLDGANARRLHARAPQVIDARRPAAIKRNLHELEIDRDAASFARALRDVLNDRTARFDLIRVRRPAADAWRDFAVGDRFQGCFSLRAAAARWGAPPWLSSTAAALERIGVLAWLEARVASDHSEITAADTYRVAYRYLDGTPLAGETTYTIAPRGDRACALEVAFTYQETTALALALVHAFGMRAHDRAVLAQAEAAASRAGGRVVRHTIRA